ncbi:ATP-binding protein [Solihabitans fulvus]|nr:tetratricopeptide repeat protein [Solihabitans fulvus]
MAGVGKSALAVHAAHALAARFPDAQLFVDLHGFTPGREPIAPAVMLDILLRRLGVPPQRIPAAPRRRADLWRNQLAGRRVLVVLDNARDATQVGQLLPDAPGCLVLVTTRHPMPALDVTVSLTLDMLPTEQAVAMSTHIVRGDRVAVEPEAVAEVVSLYDHLPQAIRVAGTRLTRKPGQPSTGLVTQLRDARRDRGELAADDRGLGRHPVLAPAPVTTVEPHLAPLHLVPAQLPPALADFVGHSTALATLVAGLAEPGLWVIAGPGGAGKSTLAIQAAHRLIGSYPDGQLHAQLRGGSGLPITPHDVLGRFLRSLGVEAGAVPPGVAERLDLFRSLVAGKRILVVLDDASDERQVRTLLPGGPGCGVVITSRRRLAGLSGATVVALGMLEEDAAIELLDRMIGPDRIAEDPVAARDIVRLCGRLPLAVRIAGARLGVRRQWPLTALARRLADERRRLDELSAGDLEVRACLKLSYAALDQPSRAAFRLLGVLGVPDFASWVVAALMDLPAVEAEDLLERLVEAHMVEIAGVDRLGELRYRLHDLVGVYATEQAEATDTEPVQRAAIQRALGGWLWLVTQVAAHEPSGHPDPCREYGTARAVEGWVAEQARADPSGWFEAEGSPMSTAVERAAGRDLTDVAYELAAALGASTYLTGNRFDEWHRTHEAALTATRRTGHRVGEATLLTGLGQLHYEADRYPLARELLDRALTVFDESGDEYGQAVALASIGATCREQGQLRESRDHLARAGAMFAALEEDAGLGYTGRLSGSVDLELGDYAAALTAFDQTLVCYRRLGSRRGEALTLRGIGLVHRAKGEHEAAVEFSRQALDILREIGDELMAAYTVQSLVKAQIRLGRGESAPLEEALSVCEAHHDPLGQGIVLRTIAELHLAEGRPAEAEVFLQRALAVWEPLDALLFRARGLRDLASVHTALGDRPRAAVALAEALSIFASQGAREYRELTSCTGAGVCDVEVGLSAQPRP